MVQFIVLLSNIFSQFFFLHFMIKLFFFKLSNASKTFFYIYTKLLHSITKKKKKKTTTTKKILTLKFTVYLRFFQIRNTNMT